MRTPIGMLASTLFFFALPAMTAQNRAKAQHDEGYRHPAPHDCCGHCWYEPPRQETRYRYETTTVWVQRRVLVGWEWREVTVSGRVEERYDPASDSYVPVHSPVVRRERVPVYRVELAPETRTVRVAYQVWAPGRWHHCHHHPAPWPRR